MIRANLLLLLWGILIVVVDVKLDWLDVLFDPIGYCLMLGGLISLGRTERSFATAVPFAFCALVVSFPLTFGVDPAYLTSMVAAVLDFFVFWYLCTGVMRLAVVQGNLSLSAAATRQRTLTFAMASANLAIAAIGRVAPELASVFVIPVVAFALVVLTLTLMMLHRASVELAS